MVQQVKHGKIYIWMKSKIGNKKEIMPKSSSRQNHTETNICLWSSCTIDNISEFMFLFFFFLNQPLDFFFCCFCCFFFFFSLLKFYFVLYTDSNKNTAQLAQGVHGKLSLLASDPAHNTKKTKPKPKQTNKKTKRKIKREKKIKRGKK